MNKKSAEGDAHRRLHRAHRENAVMGRAAANRDTALEVMTCAGAVPASTEAVAYHWLKIAGAEVFRQVSKLVK